MKAIFVAVLLILCASSVLAQSYSEIYGHPWSRTHYGHASYYKGDSMYVWNGTGKWNTVTASLDTTAGTTSAWICFGNDSTNAIPLTYGIGGNWGASRTFRIRSLTYIRQVGNVRVQYVIE